MCGIKKDNKRFECLLSYESNLKIDEKAEFKLNDKIQGDINFSITLVNDSNEDQHLKVETDKEGFDCAFTFYNVPTDSKITFDEPKVIGTVLDDKQLFFDFSITPLKDNNFLVKLEFGTAK